MMMMYVLFGDYHLILIFFISLMVEYKGIELIRTNSTIQKTRENQKNKNAKECC
jgi:hypothetical protein